MPMPTRWTKEVRQSIMAMIRAGKSEQQIEQDVGAPWHYILDRLAYHARMEALDRRRNQEVSEAESDRVAALYKPKVERPGYLQKYAGRKAFG